MSLEIHYTRLFYIFHLEQIVKELVQKKYKIKQYLLFFIDFLLVPKCRAGTHTF